MDLRTGYVPGCIGRIAQLHGDYYARHAGFGAAFEARVATELSAFCVGFQPGRDGLWLAEEDGTVHGSIAIQGGDYAMSGARLRWFILSDTARGKGVGSRLLGEAMKFCHSRGYSKVSLWTLDSLHAARHLYEKHGFRLAKTQRGNKWGKDVDELLFTLGSDG